MKSNIANFLRTVRYKGIIRPYKSFLAPIVRNLITKNDKFTPQVIVKIDGGLGSQMWQYAIGRGVHSASKMPVLYDLSWYEKNGLDINGKYSRKYELEDVFPSLKIAKASYWRAKFYQTHFDGYPGRSERRHYDSRIFTSLVPRYLGDYYSNAKYIDSQGDSLRKEFEFKVPLSEKNETLFKYILSADCPVALHIRRGDFVNSVHDVVTPDYFRSAIAMLSNMLAADSPTFFVFSNGMEWCKSFLNELDGKFVYVENNDNDSGAVDMYLMSQCVHFIISNSSFSWWAAWLSNRRKNKKVLMPEIWYKHEKEEDKFSMKVDDWLAVPV